MGRVWTKKLDPHLPWDTGKGRSGVRRGCRKSFTIYASLGSSFLGRISTSLGPFWVIFVSICPALINYDRSSPPNGLRGAALVTFVKPRCGSGEVSPGCLCCVLKSKAKLGKKRRLRVRASATAAPSSRPTSAALRYPRPGSSQPLCRSVLTWHPNPNTGRTAADARFRL